jgi:hypothetical protein
MIRRRTALLTWRSFISGAALAAVASIAPIAQAQSAANNEHQAGATESPSMPLSPPAPLIDNLAEEVRSATTISTGAVDLWAAQSFRTDASSYTLVSIDTTMGNFTGGAVVAELRAGSDPTGPLVTTLTAGTVPGVGLGGVTLTPDTPAVLDGLTRYFLVVYGPEGTSYDWAYAEGNNYVGPGYFDNFWYTSDRGATWDDSGGENPFFLRVNVGPVAPLIDNLAELLRDATAISTGAVDFWAAQSFQTDARSYELLSIDTTMGNLTGGAVAAELRSGDDPTGPLVTTLTTGTVPGAGLGTVTLTPDAPTVLDALTRYFLVIYGPEGTAFDWAYAEGNNYVGPGYFDSYWYTSDRGATWSDFGGDNPYFLRVNVACPDGSRTDSSCVFLTDTGGDPQIHVGPGACDAAQGGAPVDVITGDLRGLIEAGGAVPLPRSTCVADDAPVDRVTAINIVSPGCNPAIYILARRGLSEQSDWGTASSGALRLGGEGACP